MNADEPEDPMEAWPPELVPPLRHDTRMPPRVHEAGVPRRFGMGTLLLITAMYAVLFAVLRAFRLPRREFVPITLFFTAVGLGQMLFFKGEHPRRASIVVGAIFFAVSMSIQLLRSAAPFNASYLHWLCAFFFMFTIYGAFVGYCCGFLIAVVFLLVDKMKSRLAAFRRTENND